MTRSLSPSPNCIFFSSVAQRVSRGFPRGMVLHLKLAKKTFSQGWNETNLLGGEQSKPSETAQNARLLLLVLESGLGDDSSNEILLVG